MKVFAYVKTEDLERITECGIKLDEYSSTRLNMGVTEKKYIIGYLNPADSNLFTKDEYAPLKLKLSPEKVLVAEGLLRKNLMEDKYIKSAKKLSEYRLGEYRQPECLIGETIFPELIEKYNKVMDEPLLYGNSEELYIDLMFSKIMEEDPKFKENALDSYFGKIENEEIYVKGKCRIYSSSKGIDFIHNIK